MTLLAIRCYTFCEWEEIMAGLSSFGNAERQGFYKINPILIIVLLIVFIPLSILTSLSFFSTKQNSGLPTIFGKVVVQSNRELVSEDIVVGEKLILKQTSNFLKNQVVGYYEPSEEVTEDAPKVNVGLVQYIAKDENNNNIYGIVGEEYYVVEEAIIGVLDSKSGFMIAVISFLSSKLSLLLLSILPLGIILILLVLDIIEQKNIRKINLEIDGLSAKLMEDAPDQKVEQKAVFDTAKKEGNKQPSSLPPNMQTFQVAVNQNKPQQARTTVVSKPQMATQQPQPKPQGAPANATPKTAVSGNGAETVNGAKVPPKTQVSPAQNTTNTKPQMPQRPTTPPPKPMPPKKS